MGLPKPSPLENTDLHDCMTDTMTFSTCPEGRDCNSRDVTCAQMCRKTQNIIIPSSRIRMCGRHNAQQSQIRNHIMHPSVAHTTAEHLKHDEDSAMWSPHVCLRSSSATRCATQNRPSHGAVRLVEDASASAPLSMRACTLKLNFSRCIFCYLCSLG